MLTSFRKEVSICKMSTYNVNFLLIETALIVPVYLTQACWWSIIHPLQFFIDPRTVFCLKLQSFRFKHSNGQTLTLGVFPKTNFKSITARATWALTLGNDLGPEMDLWDPVRGEPSVGRLLMHQQVWRKGGDGRRSRPLPLNALTWATQCIGTNPWSWISWFNKFTFRELEESMARSRRTPGSPTLSSRCEIQIQNTWKCFKPPQFQLLRTEFGEPDGRGVAQGQQAPPLLSLHTIARVFGRPRGKASTSSR